MFGQNNMNPRLNLIIPKHLSDSVIEFAEISGLSYFRHNGNGRIFCNLNLVENDLSKSISKFSDTCYQSIGIDEFVDETMFGNFIGVNSIGGFVHQHKDFLGPNGEYHLRINFLVQKPIGGGTVLIEEIPYEIEEGNSWINYASSWVHGSTVVEGMHKRIVLSLGKFVKPEIAEPFLHKIIN